MRRRSMTVSALALAVFAALCIASAATGARHAAPNATAASADAPSAAATCTSKHCPPNTHCCYSCNGSPICVKNGVPCPECAPQ